MVVWAAMIACASNPAPTAGEAVAARARARFAWPDAGLVLDVAATRERIRIDGQRRSVWSQTAAYVLTATPRRGGFEVAPSGLRMGEGTDPTLLDALAFSVHPPFVVERGGRFVGVVDEARVSREARALAAAMGEAPLDPRAVVAGARDDWTALVGDWNDVELAAGQPIVDRGKARVPGLEKLAETTTERGYRGLVPCAAELAEARCVALSRVERVADAARADVLAVLDAAMAADLAGQGIGGHVVDFSLEYTHELVAEPEALVPRRFVTRRTSGLVIETDTGQRHEIVQIDRLERRFTPRP